MIVFDYRCTHCNHSEELFVSGVALSVMECPVCGEETFTKQFATPSLRFGTPNDPNAMTAIKELKKIAQKDQDAKVRRQRKANGGTNSGTILVR